MWMGLGMAVWVSQGLSAPGMVTSTRLCLPNSEPCHAGLQEPITWQTVHITPALLLSWRLETLGWAAGLLAFQVDVSILGQIHSSPICSCTHFC